MLKYTIGNLLDLAEQGEFDVIVHGCNCQNTMGSGIAYQIKNRYPEAYAADTEFMRGRPAYNKLGNYSVYHNFSNKPYFTVVNAYTQIHYLPRGIDHFEYASFEVILKKLANDFPDADFGFPAIGMGLAGGNKERIIGLLENFASIVTKTGGSVTVVVLPTA